MCGSTAYGWACWGSARDMQQWAAALVSLNARQRQQQRCRQQIRQPKRSYVSNWLLVRSCWHLQWHSAAVEAGQPATIRGDTIACVGLFEAVPIKFGGGDDKQACTVGSSSKCNWMIFCAAYQAVVHKHLMWNCSSDSAAAAVAAAPSWLQQHSRRCSTIQHFISQHTAAAAATATVHDNLALLWLSPHQHFT